MQKNDIFIRSIASLFFIIFIFLGACDKESGAPKKQQIVSKKVVAKKVSKKPMPSKGEKDEKDLAKQQKPVESPKEIKKPLKQEATSQQAEKATDDSGKISSTVLASKKKPAFKPKSEFSKESAYNKKDTPAIQVAKKQSSKPPGPIEKSLQSEKDNSIKKNKNIETSEKSDKLVKKVDVKSVKKTKGVSAEDGAVNDKKLKKEVVVKSEGKADGSFLETKETKIKQEKSGIILKPSKSLEFKKIKPITKDFEYKPKGKIDPFSSLFKLRQDSRKNKRKGFPLTPLEKVDINQFKLVGVILSAKGNNKAIVQEASGKGYVVSRGTYIGINSGRVVEILKDRIICEEEVEDLFGAASIKSKILKLHKPAGAL